MKRFIAIWILLSAGLNIWQCVHIKNLEKKRPIIVYKADNQGAEIKGKVSSKQRIGELYTLTIDGNTYIVSEMKYNEAQIGDEVEI